MASGERLFKMGSTSLNLKSLPLPFRLNSIAGLASYRAFLSINGLPL
jgi:hypothetical protein